MLRRALSPGSDGQRGIGEFERRIAMFSGDVDALKWQCGRRRLPKRRTRGAVRNGFRRNVGDLRIDARKCRLREDEPVALREIEIAAADDEILVGRRDLSAENGRAKGRAVVFARMRRKRNRIRQRLRADVRVERG